MATLRSGLFVSICDQFTTGRSLVTQRALLSMKMAVFTDTPMNFVAPSGKRGQIPDEMGKIASLSGKKAWNPDYDYKKRDTPIGVSLVSIW